ncbi:MAG: ATP-dependent metallopeptidase FtsH/Yme1/Tma family protein, partial [Gammaproteobacteria bacterium]
MDQKQRFSFWYFLVAALLLLGVQHYFAVTGQVQNLSYDEFKSLLKAGKLDNVAIGDRTITGKLKPDGLRNVLPPERLERLKSVQ